MTDNSRIKRGLMSWGVGRAYVPVSDGPGAAVVMVEDAGHLDAVLGSDVVASDALVFVPEPAEVDAAGGVELVGYEGDPAEAATELTVGADIFVQLQDYATAEYMSLIGPTLLRLIDPADFGIYLGDLDRAVEEGDFAEYLVHPAVQMADQAALQGVLDVDGPSLRLHLRKDGTWSTSATGASLGELGASWDALRGAWDEANGSASHPCAVAVAQVVPEDERSRAWQDRPWAGHFLAAQGARRDLAARGVVDVSVSGFGGRLSPAMSAWPTVAVTPGPTPDASSPVLAWTEDQAFLHLPHESRTFTLAKAGAALVEVLLAHGSVDAAAEVEDRGQLEQAAQALRTFGVDVVLGEPVR